MPEQKEVQQSRFSEAEKELIRSTFSDKEDLLLMMRDLFLGLGVSEQERNTLGELFAVPGIKSLLKKMFLPQLEKGIPLGQSVDLWMTVKMDSPDMAETNIKARAYLIEKLEQALSLLGEPKNGVVDLSVAPLEQAETYMGRASFVSHVEMQLMTLRVLANTKVEVSQNKKNSNK